MSEPMLKFFTGLMTKALGDDGRRIVRTTASSNVEDLHGDIIDEEAIHGMVRQINETGLGIFLNHSYELPEDLFGTAYSAAAALRTDKAGQLVVDMDIELDLNEANPRAIQMYDALPEPGKKRGMKVGTSIGANVIDWEYRDTKKGRESGYRIKELLLLEASIVGIPANPRSWVQMAKDALTKVDLEADVVEFDAKGKQITMGEVTTETTTEVTIEVIKEACSCGHGAGCMCADCDCAESMHAEGAEKNPSELVSEADEIVEMNYGDDWELAHEPEYDLVDITNALADGTMDIDKIDESHPELPDSAFACVDSKGRHYPHHTSSGGVNKSLLRNALARIADGSNTQCGKSHLEAHAKDLGIGDRKDETPDIAATTEPDTAEETTPEVDLEATIESVKFLVESDDRDVLVSTVIKVLEHASEQLAATRLEVTALKEQLQSATDARDEATRSFELAAEIVDAMAKQPLVKKTRHFEEQAAAVRNKYAGYGFSEGFIDILERNSTNG